MADDDEDKPKSLVIFGKDLGKMPCFRESYLYGIGGGMASGLGYFMFTSNVLRATHFSVGSFMTIATCYWFWCRYNYFQSKFRYDQMKALMNADSTIEDIKLADLDKPYKEKIDLKTA